MKLWATRVWLCSWSDIHIEWSCYLKSSFSSVFNFLLELCGSSWIGCTVWLLCMPKIYSVPHSWYQQRLQNAVQLSSFSIRVKRKCGQVLWPPLIPDQQLLKPCLRLCEGVWFWESIWTDNFWSVWGCIQNHLATQCSLEWARFFSRGIKREGEKPFNSNFSCNCVETLRF